ncbi:MAG: hypothetical protein RL385_1131 [Pseudomonadota bacterium]|jgi:hypothetical protein
MLRLRSVLMLLTALSALSSAPIAAQDAAAAPAGDIVDFTSAPIVSQADAASPPVTAPAPSVAPGVDNPAPRPAPVATPVVVPMALTPRSYRANALNFSVLGFVIGNLRLTYERLLRPKHGLYIEGIIAPDVLNGFDFVGYGSGMGYRFHWSGPGTGGFVGAGVALLRYRGKIAVYDLDDGDTYDYRGSLFSVGVGPHVGKRWLWERTGINLTIRVGAGLVLSKTYPKQNVPKKATDGLTRFPIGAEGELSIGYSF